MANSVNEINDRRKRRNRFALKQVSGGKVRLSVFRSNLHIYAQVIDDAKGATLVACSTAEKDVRAQLKNTSNIAAASLVGKLVAERAKKAGVTTVVFDRGGYKFHGRVKAVAEAARNSGLAF